MRVWRRFTHNFDSGSQALSFPVPTAMTLRSVGHPAAWQRSRSSRASYGSRGRGHTAGPVVPLENTRALFFWRPVPPAREARR